METVHIYNKNNLDNVIERPIISLQDFKNRIREYFPDYDPNMHIISEIKFINPIFSGNELREMTKEEAYKSGKYQMTEKEIYINGEIKELQLCECEKIENNKIVFDRHKKLEIIKNQLHRLKTSKIEKGFEFKPGIFQKVRLDDKINLIGAVQSGEDKNWKFTDKNGNDVIIKVTAEELEEMKIIGEKLLENAIYAEKLTFEIIEKKENEDLKILDINTLYEEIYIKTKEANNVK